MSSLILPYRDVYPRIDPTAFIAENAVIIGDVTIGAHSNIWYGCVLRGDVNAIRVGDNSNIQDGTIVHVASANNPLSAEGYPTIIGDRVTIGHLALIHACCIGDESLVGMKACVMDGARVAARSILAAGAVLTPSKATQTGELWSGIPARLQRQISSKEAELIDWTWAHYVKLAQSYQSKTDE